MCTRTSAKTELREVRIELEPRLRAFQASGHSEEILYDLSWLLDRPLQRWSYPDLVFNSFEFQLTLKFHDPHDCNSVSCHSE